MINNVTVKTAKNQSKFAVLHVSDISGTTEVTLFGEVYNRSREILEVGNIVLIQLTCFKNDGQIRFSADAVQKFDKNYNGEGNFAKKIYSYPSRGNSKPKLLEMTLRIIISDKKEWLGVKSLISKFKKNGNYSVELKFPEGTMVLPDKYNLSSYDVLDVRDVVGVNNVIEIQNE